MGHVFLTEIIGTHNPVTETPEIMGSKKIYMVGITILVFYAFYQCSSFVQPNILTNFNDGLGLISLLNFS